MVPRSHKKLVQLKNSSLNKEETGDLNCLSEGERMKITFVFLTCFSVGQNNNPAKGPAKYCPRWRFTTFNSQQKQLEKI